MFTAVICDRIWFTAIRPRLPMPPLEVINETTQAPLQHSPAALGLRAVTASQAQPTTLLGIMAWSTDERLPFRQNRLITCPFLEELDSGMRL